MPGVHHHHPPSHLGDDAQVMSNEDDGHPKRVLEFLHEIKDLGLDRNVEGSRGFVGNEEVRMTRQRHCDHGALAHASRHLVRIVVDAPVRV